MKSLQRSDEERCIRKREKTSRWPVERKVWRNLNGHKGESRKQNKADLEPRLAVSGGQGVHREVESEGHEEKYRAVIDGGYPEDELVGQRWGKVEPAL